MKALISATELFISAEMYAKRKILNVMLANLPIFANIINQDRKNPTFVEFEIP